jgi:hypothetical protein
MDGCNDAQGFECNGVPTMARAFLLFKDKRETLIGTLRLRSSDFAKGVIHRPIDKG